MLEENRFYSVWYDLAVYVLNHLAYFNLIFWKLNSDAT